MLWKNDLGIISNIAVKVDYINFTEDAFDNRSWKTVYSGVEGYSQFLPTSISDLKPLGRRHKMMTHRYG